jgi:hypothetical protein
VKRVGIHLQSDATFESELSGKMIRFFLFYGREPEKISKNWVEDWK